MKLKRIGALVLATMLLVLCCACGDSSTTTSGTTGTTAGTSASTGTQEIQILILMAAECRLRRIC